MRQFTYLLLIAICLLPSAIFSQINDSLANSIGHGISIISGYSYCAVKDEYISSEKYTGSSANYSFSWSKLHGSYLYDLRMDAISNAVVNNNNVSAEVTDFNLCFAYCYPVGSVNIFGRKMTLFMGPYPELYFHFRSQNIAQGGTGVYDAYSAALLFSLGGKIVAYLSLNESILLSGEISTNLISIGGKIIDTKNSKDSMIRLLTVFAGIRFSSRYEMDYKISDLFSLGVGYKFNLTKISIWDPLLFSSDNLFLSATISF